MVLLSACFFVCCSWGFLVHRTIHQLAIYELPSPMMPFFYAGKEYLVKQSVRPDLRRSEDSMEASRHFIDLEVFGDSAAWKMPLSWEGALAKYGRDSLLEYGYVPYYIMAQKEKLSAAFRAMNRDSILFYAADLAHYISDAHVPLHTSVNYDGQLSNQKGLHALWETVVPSVEMRQYQLSSRHRARYLKQPEFDLWQAIRQAHALLPDIFEKEKEISRSFPDSLKYRLVQRQGKQLRYFTDEFARAYAHSLGNTINEQLIRSADMVADFWYTAWVDAGSPDLSRLQSTSEHADRRQCRKERKAFKHNKLQEKGLLLSLRPDESR